jgi:hypothetical protein
MDSLVGRLKDSLNSIEDRFNDEEGKTFHTKMMNYFTVSKEESFPEATSSVTISEEAGDLDDESLEDPELEDDQSVSSDSTQETKMTEKEKCGTILERVWLRRSKALRTDIAIAGWMCSPNEDVRRDCNSNHNGEHRFAVSRLLKQWYIHEVKFV